MISCFSVAPHDPADNIIHRRLGLSDERVDIHPTRPCDLIRVYYNGGWAPSVAIVAAQPHIANEVKVAPPERRVVLLPEPNDPRELGADPCLFEDFSRGCVTEPFPEVSKSAWKLITPAKPL